MIIFRKIIAIVVICITITLIGSGIVSALEYTRSQSKIDSSISDQTTKQYSEPESIYIVQISSKDPLMEKSPETWFKTLYYYSITRLGFVDIPFTYVVDRDGNLYHGRDGGDNVTPEIVANEGAIVIGYLSNSSDITAQVQDTLRSLVTKLSYTYGIPKKNLKVAEMKMTKKGDVATKSSLQVINTTFSQTILTTLGTVSFTDKEHIDYKVEIVDVKYDSKVKSGEKLGVTLTIKNSNDFPWFTNKDYIYVSTKSGGDSQFAINGVWDSFSKPVSIANKTILPGESIDIEFDLQALLLPGKYSENFNIIKSPNIKFANSEIKVNFEVTKGDYNLVRVVNTPVLNVRECPSGSCKSITQLDEDQVVIMLENNLAGWYKIRYADKKEGWVFGQYIREL